MLTLDEDSDQVEVLPERLKQLVARVRRAESNSAVRPSLRGTTPSDLSNAAEH